MTAFYGRKLVSFFVSQIAKSKQKQKLFPLNSAPPYVHLYQIIFNININISSYKRFYNFVYLDFGLFMRLTELIYDFHRIENCLGKFSSQTDFECLMYLSEETQEKSSMNNRWICSFQSIFKLVNSAQRFQAKRIVAESIPIEYAICIFEYGISIGQRTLKFNKMVEKSSQSSQTEQNEKGKVKTKFSTFITGLSHCLYCYICCYL